MSRGRGFSQDWDPMREDFDNSAYDPQYPDDNSSNFVSLDHTRLYITNIPRGLSDEGVFAAFSKYGRPIEKHISGNPQKRYGLIGFETPGEAKLAMMKLNRTEPLNLNVRVAHKRKVVDDNHTARGPNDREERSFREDTASVGSRSNSRRHPDMSNGDNMDDSLEDVAVNSLDPDTKLELEQLKLERLQLQEAQLACRERMLLKQAEKKLQSSTSRRVLPTGKIVLCNNATAEVGRDNDANFVAGAGDSLKIPGLQRVGYCVVCGERAAAFCAACGVTPYCSERCQRRDWQHRHRQVCHNLKRTSAAVSNVARSQPEFEPEPASPAPAPLRRPRSPEAARERRDDDSGSDRAPPRKFGPPGSNVPTLSSKDGRNARGTRNPDQSNNSYDRGDRANNSNNRADKPGNSYDRGDRANNSYDRGDRPSNDRARNDRANNAYDRGDMPKNDRGDRPNNNDRSRPTQNGHRNFNDRNDDRKKNDARKEQDDGWNAKPESKPQASIPLPTIKPKTPLAQSAEKTHQPVTKPPVVQETRKETLVPKNSAVELLTASDTIIMTVDAAAASCRADSGFVCLTIPVKIQDQYVGLMEEEFSARQAAGAVCRPKPGDTFAYLNPEDEAWYRARCVAPNKAALLDAARVIDLSPESQCRALHADDAALPEFCCLLEDAKVQLGVSLNGTVISNTDGVVTVSLEDAATSAAAGTARLRRWLPRVDAPPAASATSAAPAASAAPPVAPTSTTPASNIPDVPRPPVTNNCKVLIIDAPKPSRVFVRPAGREQQRRFDDVVQEVALYGMDATPLTEVPTVGDTVVAKYEDGIHYRALVRRVSQKNNKCLLEYIDYGNDIATFLGDIYPCPPELTVAARPTLASHVTFEMPYDMFTPAAVEYINAKKEYELTLTIPSGAQSGGTGTAVKLTTERGEDVNRAIEELCTPEWKKLLARGGDVLEMAVLVYKDLVFVDPPESGEMEILDMRQLETGTLSGHARGAPHVALAFEVERQLVEYCNSPLCKEPYLPMLDEVCVVFCPKRQKWVRAVLVDHKHGEPEAVTLLVDYGSVEHVPVAALRKLSPEYVRAAPAAVYSLEIRDFPEKPTPEQLARARRHMNTDGRGRGSLRYTRVLNTDHGDYTLDAPDLLRDMH